MKKLLVVSLVMAYSTAVFAGRSTSDPKKNPPTVEGAPIPAKVLTAKTVALVVTADNQEYYYKTAYKYLAEWDRWKIIPNTKSADLILKITNKDDGTVGVGSGSAGGGPGYASGSAIALGLKLHHFYLLVIEPGTGELLWATDTDQRFAKSANATRMLKHLKQRITDTEKSTPATK